jgi:predicted Zn-dependent peptidase
MSVREELGLVYSIGSYLDYNLDGALYQISTQTEPENSDNVIAEVERQIDIICNDEPTEEELTRAKNKIKSKTYSKLDTSMGALSDLLNKECYGFKTGSGFIKDVESVTSSDIREIVKIIFGGSKYILIGASE